MDTATGIAETKDKFENLMDRRTPLEKEIAERRKAFQQKIAKAAANVAQEESQKKIQQFIEPKSKIVAAIARPALVQIILKKVSSQYKITEHELLSARQSEKVWMPRHIAYYLCQQLTGYSYPQIAKFMNKKDHTTIMHGVRKIEEKIANDVEFKKEIQKLKRKISE
jgi:chromosomal replication initiator protein